MDYRKMTKEGLIKELEAIKSKLKAFENIQSDVLSHKQAHVLMLGADVGKALTLSESLSSMLKMCTEALVKHLGVSFARVWILNNADNILVLMASAGLYTHIDGPHSHISVGSFKIGLIAQTQKPHLTNDVLNDPRVSNKEWARREGMIAFAGYPLIVEDRLVGVMAMFARRPLSEGTIDALASVSDQIALGIKRKQMEKELRVSHKMSSIGRLTASVFHEILNPVNIISAHTQLLLMEAEKGSKTEEDLKSIQGEIDRIVNITDRLLTFSKKEDAESEEIDINGLLKNTLSLSKPELNLKSIKPITKIENGLPEVMAHGDELRQVFLNLITNAIDAMPEGGTLTIMTLLEGDSARITFEDTGCGIATEHIDKVFEPFFSTKKEIKGVGLGLSTSYAIIEGFGGKMSVESKEGKGTTFTIDLPVKI